MRSLLVEDGLDGQVEVDSAAIGAWHVGQRADPRARAAAAKRGIEVTSIARQVRASDFENFDLVLAADETHRRDLLALAGADPERRAKVRMIRDFDPAASPREVDVPDPYYGGDEGFEEMIDLLDSACRGLRDRLVADELV